MIFRKGDWPDEQAITTYTHHVFGDHQNLDEKTSKRTEKGPEKVPKWELRTHAVWRRNAKISPKIAKGAQQRIRPIRPLLGKKNKKMSSHTKIPSKIVQKLEKHP